MRYHNAKTQSDYVSPQLLVVGPVGASIRTITTYGFYRAMIHVGDGGPFPANKQFIVSEKIPDGRSGDTITADRFAATMDSRRVTAGKFPSLAKQAENLAGTMVDFARDGFRTVDDTERNRRLDICATCEHFVGGRCSKCGCFQSIKSWINAADCPTGKW